LEKILGGINSMMNDSVDITKDRASYLRLDRFLLYLLMAELGYFILLIFAGLVAAIFEFLIGLPSLYMFSTSILWPVLPFIIALPLNVLGGLLSIVLNIRTKHEGFPGTGHLLNWIFLMTTGWLFIVALVFLLPSMAGSY
jgi:hypothetical protein